jgi:hypothetical protein
MLNGFRADNCVECAVSEGEGSRVSLNKLDARMPRRKLEKAERELEANDVLSLACEE